MIRKRRRWTANMAVAWTVSSSEHFSSQGKISWDILNAMLCHKYHPNHSNRVICSEWRQHLEMGEYTIYFFADISTWKRARSRSRSNIWKKHTHTEGHKCDTFFWFLFFFLNDFFFFFFFFALYDPLWMILLIFGKSNGVKMSEEFPTAFLDITLY